MSLSKIEKVESQADYESTVPANVRLANEEKVSPITWPSDQILTYALQRKTLEADIRLLDHSIDMFTKLK